MGRSAILMLALAACYDSPVPAGTYACASDGDCAGDQVCRASEASAGRLVCAPALSADTVAGDAPADTRDTDAAGDAGPNDTRDAGSAETDADAPDDAVGDGGDVFDTAAPEDALEPPATDLTGDWRGYFVESGDRYFMRITQTGNAVATLVGDTYEEWAEHVCVGTFTGTHFYCSYSYPDDGGVLWLVEAEYLWHAANDSLSGTWKNHKFLEFGDFDINFARYAP